MKSYGEPFYDRNRVKLEDVIPLDTPFTIIIDTSETCNFKCNYCFRANIDKSKATYSVSEGLMTWQTFIHILNQIKEFPNEVKRISLSGHGEPLNNTLLPEMVKKIKEEGLHGRTEIHTNASRLLDYDFNKELADSKIDKVIISLQGITTESYQETCAVKLDFNKLLEAIRFFYENKTSTELCIKVADVAIKGNEEKFFETFYEISDKLNIEKVVPIYSGIETFLNLDESINKYGASVGVQTYCNQIFYTLLITPKGYIYPCADLDPPIGLGNVWETSLVEAWNSSIRYEFLYNSLKNGICSYENCRDCYIPINNIKEHSDIISSDNIKILKRIEDKIKRKR